MRFTSGFSWFAEALGYLRRRPMALCAVCVFNFLASLVLSGLPFVGVLLAALWVPFGTLLASDAARLASADRDPDYGVLSRAWHDKAVRYGLLTIGAAYAVTVEVTSLVFSFLAQKDMAAWVVKDGMPTFDSVTANFPWAAVIVLFVVYLVLMMANAFAPLLIARGGQSWKQSLFYSFFGSLKNWAAALAFGIALILTAILMTAILMAIAFMLGAGGVALYVAPFVTVFSSVVLQLGLWPAYRDIFAARPE